jgi:hypothetical protein
LGVNHLGEPLGDAAMSKDAWDIPERIAEDEKERLRISPKYREQWDKAFQSYLAYLASLPETRRKDQSHNQLEDSFLVSPQAEELCQRWNLALALHPDDELWDVSREHARALFKDLGQTVEVIPHSKAKNIPIPLEHLTSAELAFADEWSRRDLTLKLRDGHYLRLKINHHAGRKRVRAEARSRISFFLRHVTGRKLRVRTPPFDGEPVRKIDTEDGRMIIEADLRYPVDQLIQRISQMVCYQPSGKQRRIRGGKRISKYRAWELYNKEKSFVKAAIKAGLGEATFRKAYYRDFEKIMGKKYDPSEHGRKKKFINADKGLCGKCQKRETCTVLCPDALAYYNQDVKSHKSNTVISPDVNNPVDAAQRDAWEAIILKNMQNKK